MRNSKVAYVAIAAAALVAILAIVVLRPQTTAAVTPAETPAANVQAPVSIGRHITAGRTSQDVTRNDDKGSDSQGPTTTTTPPSDGGNRPPVHGGDDRVPVDPATEDPGPPPVVRDHRGENGAPQGGVSTSPSGDGPVVRDHRHHDCPWYNPGC
jgi:hypothetical protein